MKPFFFPSGGRQLLGLYHPPTAGAKATGEAVVFCNPFGQEAIRSHRMYRVLADRVARGGRAALRFDYSSTGDSEGACMESSLQAWTQDVCAADAELRKLSRASKVTWVGLRLGASLAVMASQQGAGPDRLVLWDPVISGPEYLGELARSHVGFIASVFRWTTERASRSRGIRNLEALPELVGFEISDALRKEIFGIARSRLGSIPSATRVVVLGNQDSSGCAAWVAELAAKGLMAEYVGVDDDTPWNSEEALNASTIPARALEALLAAMENPK
jgi:hypothetical protein